MDANRMVIMVFFLEWMSLYTVSQFYDAIIMGLEIILLRLSI